MLADKKRSTPRLKFRQLRQAPRRRREPAEKLAVRFLQAPPREPRTFAGSVRFVLESQCQAGHPDATFAKTLPVNGLEKAPCVPPVGRRANTVVQKVLRLLPRGPVARRSRKIRRLISDRVKAHDEGDASDFAGAHDRRLALGARQSRRLGVLAAKLRAAPSPSRSARGFGYTGIVLHNSPESSAGSGERNPRHKQRGTRAKASRPRRLPPLPPRPQLLAAENQPPRSRVRIGFSVPLSPRRRPRSKLRSRPTQSSRVSDRGFAGALGSTSWPRRGDRRVLDSAMTRRGAVNLVACLLACGAADGASSRLLRRVEQQHRAPALARSRSPQATPARHRRRQRRQ